MQIINSNIGNKTDTTTTANYTSAPTNAKLNFLKIQTDTLATKSDVQNLQNQINSIQTSVASMNSDMSTSALSGIQALQTYVQSFYNYDGGWSHALNVRKESVVYRSTRFNDNATVQKAVATDRGVLQSVWGPSAFYWLYTHGMTDSYFRTVTYQVNQSNPNFPSNFNSVYAMYIDIGNSSSDEPVFSWQLPGVLPVTYHHFYDGLSLVYSETLANNAYPEQKHLVSMNSNLKQTSVGYYQDAQAFKLMDGIPNATVTLYYLR